MESRPGRRHRRSPPPPDGSDLISALPDEMLRLVIARISCVRTTVRTGLISRRGRGLWTGVAHPSLMLRDFTLAMTKALFVRFSASAPLPTIDIRLSYVNTVDSVREANSLLRSVALFSPAELVFTLTENFVKSAPLYIEMPCFHRATSIELDTASLSLRMMPPASEFTKLESLSLKGKIVDLGAMLDRCPRLRTVRLAFRQVALDSVDASLKEALPGVSVCLLDICILRGEGMMDAARFASLLRAATRLSPQELVLTRDFAYGRIDDDMTLIDAELPCFNNATSIEMSLPKITFTPLSAGAFLALEKLSLSGCTIMDLATLLVTRCPRLRVLTLVFPHSTNNITIHSMTLKELNIYRIRECRSIDIVTPVLQQLMLNVHANTDLSVSIDIELLEYDGLGPELDFALEMEKFLVTEFSMLELHLEAANHVFGALVSCLFGMHHIRTATERLRVILEYPFKATKEWQNCPCHKLKDWRSQSISLPRLEDVEIEGFNGEPGQLELLKLVLGCAAMLKTLSVKLAQNNFLGRKLKGWTSQSNSLPHLEEVKIEGFSGENQQLDLLKLLLGSAPMLKTVTVKLAQEINRENFRGGIRKINNIFLAYPYVNNYVYLYAGGVFRRAHG